MKKYPINGLCLEKKIKWGNPPEVVFIFVGGSNLEASKTNGIYYIALEYDQTPEHLIWPVAGIHALIVWGYGPDYEMVKRVYNCAVLAGAKTVNVTVSNTDYDIKSSRFGRSEDIDVKQNLSRIINNLGKKK